MASGSPSFLSRSTAPDDGVEQAADVVRVALDALVVSVAVLDATGTIVAANESWERFAGAQRGWSSIGSNLLAGCEAAPEDPAAGAVATGIRAVLAGERESVEIDYRCSSAGGERWLALRVSRHRAAGREHVLLQQEDITARIRSEDEARLAARLLDEVDAAVIATDADDVVTHWSAGAERMYGWQAEEIVGSTVAELLLLQSDTELAERLRIMRRDGRWEGRLMATHRDGSVRPALLRLVARYDDGALSGFVGVSVDASEAVAAERELRSAKDFSRAVTDSMGEGLFAVGVDGRLMYMNSAAEDLLGWRAEELEGRVVHDAIQCQAPDGDAFSAQERLSRQTGRDGSAVRVEDDVFIRRDGSVLPVAYTASQFVTPAGIRGSVYVFSDITDRKAEESRRERELGSLAWIPRIRAALRDDRFVLHAQPIVDLVTGETVQHELLVRMQDRRGRLVPPGLFLPVAEEHGLVRDIDRWVIGQAAELAGRGHSVEVNLSAASLGDRGLFGFVESALLETGADPSLVVFELTETALLRSEEPAEWFIQRVRALGCELALDDFGTGYGGFTYLKRFPVSYLKIDIEFVRDLVRDEASQHVVRAVVSLAKGFGQRTVAEGVEDEDTLRLLRELGVDSAQGYFLGRPAPPEEILRSDGR
jgi:PAS domain S-box-containing protein